LERFNGLHGIYTSLELAKVLLLMLAAWFSFSSLAAAGAADPAAPPA